MDIPPDVNLDILDTTEVYMDDTDAAEYIGVPTYAVKSHIKSFGKTHAAISFSKKGATKLYKMQDINNIKVGLVKFLKVDEKRKLLIKLIEHLSDVP